MFDVPGMTAQWLISQTLTQHGCHGIMAQGIRLEM
jgi:hypothetical protein